MKNQILHIFKNDIRHFWREIVLMAVIVIAYGWHASSHAQESGFFAADIAFSFSSQLLSLLVSVVFIFLIVRAVHAECLVGDRQFWITRPYDWRQLLAAKLLFVASFVNLPLFVLQVFLLWHSGFWLPKYLLGLLRLQVLWIAIVFLPTATLAVVTAGIGQFVLTVLGVLIYSIAVTTLMSKLLPYTGEEGATGVLLKLSLIAVYAACFVVVVCQYARRRTARSWLVLLAPAAAIPMVFAIDSYRAMTAHPHAAPRAGQPTPMRLAFDPAKPASLKGGYPEKNKVHIRLPLLVSGIAEGTMVASEHRESIEAPGGQRWESRWEYGHGFLLPNRSHTNETIAVDKDFYERVKSLSVKIKITFALTPSRAAETDHLLASAAPFTIPGEGRCAFSPLALNKAVCLFPVKSQMMLLSAKSEEITCKPGENEKPLPAGIIAYGWVYGYSLLGAEFGINPVLVRELELSDFGEVKGKALEGGVCPGTPLTIYTSWPWREGPRYRSDLEIDGIRLAEYKLDNAWESSGFGVMVP
jgi:ABC-type transport system involved in multi-copper enzyme maturation permease subunit